MLDFPNNPTLNEVCHGTWRWDGEKWVRISNRRWIAPTSPVSPNESDFWYDTANNLLKVRIANDWAETGGSDAPADGEFYGRKSGAWDVLSSNINIITNITASADIRGRGFVNKFYNGTFAVAQRGVGPFGPVSAGGGYALDGWVISSTTGNVWWGQAQNDKLAGTALFASGTGPFQFTMLQRMEARQSMQLMGYNLTPRPMTVQFTIFNDTPAPL